MNQQRLLTKKILLLRVVLPLVLAGLPLVISYWLWTQTAVVETAVAGTTAIRRVNIAHTTAVEPDIANEEAGIFWFGQAGPANDNYTDVRVIYNDEKLHIHVHILDRWLHANEPPAAAQMEQWDAVTVYLNLDGNTGTAPGTSAHQFVAQLRSTLDGQPLPADYMAAYRGNGASWDAASTTFEGNAGWRGQGVNNVAEDTGWSVTLRIPYDSLGLAGPPAAGTIWGLAVAVHDRDTAAGPPVGDTIWPENMDGNTPATWGQLHFGLPAYATPDIPSGGFVTIRDGENGDTVSDNHVGGSTNCGGGVPPFWPTWGDTHYDPTSFQMNVQNQWDISDWACFSKYFVTFPLDRLPVDKGIISATLTMYHFGNSEPSLAPTSIIQVFSLAENWNEDTITWNNAPLALENVSRTSVDPLPAGHPGQFVTWDVSQAVAGAYAAGVPLRLVLYSADEPRHTGKYFNSSEVVNPARRPTLQVHWGETYGFSVEAEPSFKAVDAGEGASYTIDVQSSGGFTEQVTISLGPAQPDLSMGLTSSTVDPPGQTTLNLTHTNGAETASIMYTVPLTATGGGITHTTTVYFLVNGSHSYLPLISK